MSEREPEKAQLAPGERRMLFTGEACEVILKESGSEKVKLAPDEFF